MTWSNFHFRCVHHSSSFTSWTCYLQDNINTHVLINAQFFLVLMSCARVTNTISRRLQDYTSNTPEQTTNHTHAEESRRLLCFLKNTAHSCHASSSDSVSSASTNDVSLGARLSVWLTNGGQGGVSWSLFGFTIISPHWSLKVCR